MARIERIKRRLDNWALWKARMNSSGLGWHGQSVLARLQEEVFGRSGYGGNYIPHLEQDAVETNEAVEKLKLGNGHLFVTLDAIYLKDWGVAETARRLGKAPSTIHAQLGQADQFIDAWLAEQARLRDEREALARGREYMKRSAGSFPP